MAGQDLTRSRLNKQAVAAECLIRDLGDDDAQLVHDMVEGETSFFEAVEGAIDEIGECEILATGLSDYIKKLQDRKKRIDGRAARVRGMIEQAFAMAEVSGHKFPSATISRKSTPPRPVVIDESQIPTKFFEPQPPKLDKKALHEALKSGDVAGAAMSNGGETIQIRRT